MKYNARIMELSGNDKSSRWMEVKNIHPRQSDDLPGKFVYYRLILENVECKAASAIEQEMISIGGGVVCPHRVASDLNGTSTIILLATGTQFSLLQKKLSSSSSASLGEIANEISVTISNYTTEMIPISFADGSRWNTGERSYVMGILNVTPDSFSDGGRYFTREASITRAKEIAAEGADIIDVGGESTRPGSEAIDAEEELRRVIPVIEAIKKNLKMKVSIDTCKSAVARRAIDAGADMINDISGFTFDGAMPCLAAETKTPAVVMHIKGIPRTMQDNPHYDNLLSEISAFLRKSIKMGAEAGMDGDKIIIDPGIGFGKKIEHNLEILRSLRTFRSLGRPIMIGVSRKSFIGKILNLGISERLEGGLAATAVAIMNGASLIRTHDVKETVRAALLLDSLRKHPL